MEYVPTSHCAHTWLPTLALYVPATQLLHTPPSTPVNPILHLQSVYVILDSFDAAFTSHDTHITFMSVSVDCGCCMKVFTGQVIQSFRFVFPARDVLLKGQFVQSADPISVLYVPTEHCIQVPPSGPVYPALHWQSVRALLPVGECELERQEVQSSLLLRDFQVSTGHMVHGVSDIKLSAFESRGGL